MTDNDAPEVQFANLIPVFTLQDLGYGSDPQESSPIVGEPIFPPDPRHLLFWEVSSKLIELYRTLDKTRRPAIKEKLETLYEDLKSLGVEVGLSRVSFLRIDDC